MPPYRSPFKVQIMSTQKETATWIQNNLHTMLYKALHHEPEQPEDATIPEDLKQPGGAFVSIYLEDQLRGCIGRMKSNDPLWQTILDMGIAACTSDHRFEPVSAGELLKCRLEVSILSPLKPVHNINEIEPGRHGIYMVDGPNSGVFLPQVALKQGWTTLQMLEHCAHDKAGIGYNGWKRANLYTFQAETFPIDPL